MYNRDINAKVDTKAVRANKQVCKIICHSVQRADHVAKQSGVALHPLSRSSGAPAKNNGLDRLENDQQI